MKNTTKLPCHRFLQKFFLEHFVGQSIRVDIDLHQQIIRFYFNIPPIFGQLSSIFGSHNGWKKFEVKIYLIKSTKDHIFSHVPNFLNPIDALIAIHSE